MKKEILIAIDGSVYSTQSLRYISTLFSTNSDITFHLCTWLTTSSSVMPSVADSKNSLIPTSSTQSKKESSAKRFLKKAAERLIHDGISPERIKTSTQISGFNFAGAIQHTAGKELSDSILIGRRGLNGISKMLMGSVSASLFKKCHNTPLWIIDGEVQSKNFLVPVDGSPNSLMAVDHLCHIFAGRHDIKFFLFHCSAFFAKRLQCKPDQFYANWDKEWCDSNLSGIDCLFNAPQKLLIDAGIPAHQIMVLPESSDLEEAHGIITEAKKQNCGTIVMGRRGKGIAKGLMGGVSDRAINHVQDLALWIVG